MSATIRLAKADDALAIARVRMISWQAAYRGIVPDAYLDAMRAEDAVERWRAASGGEMAGTEVLVCIEDGAVIGFASYGAARPPTLGFGGELHATYFLPAAMGRGFGSHMMEKVHAGLIRLGHDDMIVWVMEANTRGRNFYEKNLAMALVSGSRQSFEIAGQEIWEVAYGLRPLSLRPANR